MLIGKAGHLHTSSTAATNMMDGDGNIVTTPRNFHSNVYLPIECPPGIQKYFSDPFDCSAYHYCSGRFRFYYMISSKVRPTEDATPSGLGQLLVGHLFAKTGCVGHI